jgi:transcription elongation factor Elf1
MAPVTCPVCQSKAITLQLADSPEVLPLYCRQCGHRWEVHSNQYSPEALSRLAPMPHWR